jgi:Flp pilus assembly protein TadG
MRNHQRSRGAGQALVEFALLFPVFILILFGLLDAGRLLYMNSVLSQAAREGARVAAAEASWIGKTTTNDPSCVTSAALITGANPGAHVCPPAVIGPTNSLQADVTAAANRMVSPFGAVKDVYFSCQPTGTVPPSSWTNVDCANANRAPTKNVVWVRVDQTFTPITPVIGQILGAITTSGSATMVIN